MSGVTATPAEVLQDLGRLIDAIGELQCINKDDYASLVETFGVEPLDTAASMLTQLDNGIVGLCARIAELEKQVTALLYKHECLLDPEGGACDHDPDCTTCRLKQAAGEWHSWLKAAEKFEARATTAEARLAKVEEVVLGLTGTPEAPLGLDGAYAAMKEAETLAGKIRARRAGEGSNAEV